jgi:hypothetical protein
MSTVHYKIVPHDGGFAYKLGDVFSEPFPSHREAVRAAHRVAREQHTPGETRYIEFQDSDGKWHTERAEGADRPEVDVQG